jgi:succinoglycan biosynthesis transport protein ExoP
MNSDPRSLLVPRSSIATMGASVDTDGSSVFVPRTANTMQELFRVLSKRRRWVIAAVVLALVCSIGRALTMKPIFQSTVVIELNKSSSSAAGLELGGDSTAQSFLDGDSLLTDLQTETTILQSDALAMDVIQRLHLASQDPFAQAIRHARKKSVESRASPLSEESQTRALLLGAFKGSLKVQPIRGTRLINVSFEDRDPNRAAVVANALIDSYKDQYLQSHYNATSEASSWLTKQLEELKRNVENSEKKLTDFEKESGILSFDSLGEDKSGSGGQGHSVVLQKLDALNAELTQAEANRIEKEAIYRFTKSGNPDSILAIGRDPIASSTSSAVLTQSGGLGPLENLRQQQGVLRVALADAGTKYGENNRHLKDIQTQVSELDRQVSEEVARLATRAENDYELAKQQENVLRQRFQQQQEEATKLNGKAVELSVLSQEAFSRKKLYEDLYTKLQEANISAGIKATNITVVDPAWAQPIPVRPNLRTSLIYGLMFGMIFGVVAAFAAESMDRTVTTPVEVEEVTGRAVVGTIPLFEETGKSAHARLFKSNEAHLALGRNESATWILSRPKSAVAEACRALRTSIMLSRAGGGPRVILVTSSVPGEGKSTVSVNLAIAFAQHSKRVLIIEADLRRPSINRILKVKNHLGLSNVLTGSADFESAVSRAVAVPSLDVLSSGPTPPLPSEILDSAALDELVSQLRREYDLIVIDSPPATVVTDAIALGMRADGVLWVTRAGIVTKPLVARAAEMVNKFQLPLIGFVMNGVNLNSVDYQYSYYGYSGSSGYYDEKNS